MFSQPDKTDRSDQPQATGSPLDDVKVRLEAFIGGANMTVAELGVLTRDGIIELDSTLSSFIDVRLNGVSIAQGELVTVGDKFGVRIVSMSTDMTKRGKK